MTAVDIVTIVAGVPRAMSGAWPITAYYSKLNARAHKTLAASRQTVKPSLASRGKVVILIKMLRPLG